MTSFVSFDGASVAKTHGRCSCWMPVKFWVYLCSRSLHRFSQLHVSEAEAGPDPSGPVGSNTVRIRRNYSLCPFRIGHVKVLHGSMWHLAVASLTNRKPQEPVSAFQKKMSDKIQQPKGRGTSFCITASYRHTDVGVALPFATSCASSVKKSDAWWTRLGFVFRHAVLQRHPMCDDLKTGAQCSEVKANFGPVDCELYRRLTSSDISLGKCWICRLS